MATFRATAKQQQLLATLSDGQSRIIGFGGGIRGAKSFGIIAALILLCKMFPGSRWAIIRKDLQRLKETTYPTIEKFLTEFLPGDPFVGPLNQTTNERVCANGSVLLFRGENVEKDPDLLRFHGYEVNGFANEEADELLERTLVKEMERAGTWIIPGGVPQPPAFILNTFNPCGNWPRRRFYTPWRDGMIAAPYAFIPTTQADNPHISEAQRAAWKEMPEHEYKRFVMGDWEELTGAYYDTVTTDLLIDRDDVPDPLPSHWRCWGSFDWGYAHYSVLCAWCTDDDGMDYLLDSCWLRRMQDDEMAIEFKRDLPAACLRQVYAGHDCWSKAKAHSASGESTADVFAKAGIILMPADTDKVNGGRAVNRQVKQGRVKIVRTPGNVRGFDQLGQILPDAVDVRKPGKVDVDLDGNGGDDFADTFRFGIATRVAAAVLPSTQPEKQPGRARPMIVKHGKLVPAVKPPTNAEEMLQWIAAKQRRGHLPPRPKRSQRRYE